MKKKRLTALLSVFALAVAVAVLGGTASTAKATQQKGVTITIWDYFDAPPNGTAERDAMMKVAQQWAKKTGNKVVNPGYVANKENKFIQAAPAGQRPDILMEPHDRLGSFAVPGLLASAPKSLLSATERKDYNPASLGKGIYHPVATAAQDMVSNDVDPVLAPNGLDDLAADAVRSVPNSIIAQTLAAVGGNPANLPGYDFNPYQAALVATGVVRGGLPAGVPLTFADIYNILPLGLTPDSTQPLPVGYPLPERDRRYSGRAHDGRRLWRVPSARAQRFT